jgi:hypothetical protein
MADDISSPGGVPQPSRTGYVPPGLPPHYAQLLAQAEGMVQQASDHVTSTVDPVVSETHAQLQQIEGDLNVAVSQSLGHVDNETTAAMQAVSSAIDKLLNSTMVSVIQNEDNLRSGGVYVPVDTYQQYADMNDGTGEALVNRLMGNAPGPVENVPAEHLYTPLGGFPVTNQSDVVTNVSVPAPGPTIPPPQPIPTPIVVNATSPTTTTTTPSGEPITVNVNVPAPEVILEPVNAPPALPAPAPEPPAPAPVVNVAPVLNLPPNPLSPTPAPAPVPTPVPTPVPPVNLVPVTPPEAPPSPPPPAPGEPDPATVPITDPGWTYTGLRWDAPHICRVATEAATLYGGSDDAATFNIQDASNVVSSIIRGGLASIKTFADGVLSGFDTNVKNEVFDANLKLTGDQLGGYSAVVQTIRAVDDTSLPNKSQCWKIGCILAQARHAEEDSGFPLTYITTPLEYLYQYINPQFIPEQTELDDLRARGMMHQKTWECLTKAHGNIPAMRVPVVEAHTPQPTPDQLVILKNRNAIDKVDYQTRMTRAGFGDPVTMQWQESLQMFVPSPGDLVRFMVRDVFDEQVVKDYDLDQDFDNKFYGRGGKAAPGRAAQWAQAQGMTEDQFKYFWRAHWEIPSNTQLYECVHRLRPDREAVKDWQTAHDMLVANGQADQVPPKPPVIQVSDVQKAIQVNDMSPFWVDPLIAISYRPITISDARRGYQMGVFSDAQMLELIQDNGYSYQDAETLLSIDQSEKVRTIRQRAGIWTERDIVEQYKGGMITWAIADQLLAQMIPDPKVRNDYHIAADAESQAAIKMSGIMKFRRAYFTGYLDDQSCVNALVTLGMDLDQAQRLQAQWQPDKTGRFREPAVKTVISWYTSQIITQDQLYSRLLNLGFADSDVIVMVTAAQGTLKSAQQKAQQQADKKAQAGLKSKRDLNKLTPAQLLKHEEAMLKHQERVQKQLDEIQKVKLSDVVKEVKLLNKTAPLTPTDVQRLNESVGLDSTPANLQAEEGHSSK